MPAFIVDDFNEKIIALSDEESRHCLKVLRKNTGDIVALTDGAGTYATARVLVTGKHQCKLEVLDKHLVAPDPFHIHIAMTPVKNNDRIEWFIEKATEIGAHEISFVISRYAERHVINTGRLIKKAKSALKQSGRCYLPAIHDVKPFGAWIEAHDADEMFIAHTNLREAGLLSRKATTGKRYILLIGPEGGFSDSEVEEAIKTGYRKVSLGKNILRTETAGIIGCQMLCEINF